ncbi:MAG: hypothetical protein JWN94_588 [Betaproteobacteria bacterium]|nr:hypothetical protein [Betaproteobacteria bacterium]
MQKIQLKVIVALCGPLMVAGCAFFKPSPVQLALTPVTSLRHGAPPSEAEYQLGRAYQTGLDYEKAIVSYRKSITENPNNAEAHNALGVVYATQGKIEQAVTELMTAAALAPEAAHVQNNLGFAYLLSGRNAEATGPLTIAAKLDPANERIRENLRRAQQGAGLPVPSRDKVPDVIASAQANPPQVDANIDPNAPTLVSVAPNIFALRHNLPQITRSHPLPVARAQGAPLTVVKVEVSNGNGVAGLAKRTSSLLQERGYAIARLTNQLPYTQRVTEIQYRRGQESEARRLNALLSVPTNVVESSELSQAVGVRLVLGHDSAAQPIFGDPANRRYGKAVDETPALPRG